MPKSIQLTTTATLRRLAKVDAKDRVGDNALFDEVGHWRLGTFNRGKGVKSETKETIRRTAGKR